MKKDICYLEDLKDCPRNAYNVGYIDVNGFEKQVQFDLTKDRSDLYLLMRAFLKENKLKPEITPLLYVEPLFTDEIIEFLDSARTGEEIYVEGDLALVSLDYPVWCLDINGKMVLHDVEACKIEEYLTTRRWRRAA